MDVVNDRSNNEEQFYSAATQPQPVGGDNVEVTSWLSGQFWYLITGIMFGAAANFISRMWSVRTPLTAAPPSTSNAKYFSHDNKMVFVIRTDLNMGKGKVAAQCAHAAITCYKKAAKETPQLLKQWELFGQTKATLKGDSLEALYDLETKAKASGMVAAIVKDAGRTQVEAGSPTVLGIGPAPSTVVNEITGHLKLY